MQIDFNLILIKLDIYNFDIILEFHPPEERKLRQAKISSCVK
jgi:hypothetical protein